MPHPLSVSLILLAACGARETPVTEPPPEPTATPDVSEATDPGAPDLGEVVAVEAIVGARQSTRRSTRDPAQVAAVTGALAGATWSAGAIPRCAHALWIRLVPPSAEDGATAIFCGSDSAAAIWVPHDGAYALDAESSRALWAAAQPIGASSEGAIPPTAVSEGLSAFSLSAGVRDGPEGALRSVQLTVGLRLEPDATWPDGAPITASHELTAEQAGSLAIRLTDAGFFDRAARFHSPAVESPQAPAPAHSTEGVAEASQPGWMSVTVQSGEWHRTWHEETAPAIFGQLVWHIGRWGEAPEAAAQLEAIEAALEAR